MKRSGSAIWTGDIKQGAGTVSTESGVLSSVPYSFSKRFGDEKGSNPEELIGAAHASCFSMALSGALGGSGLTADKIETTATVSVVPDGGGFTIDKVHLVVKAAVPGTDAETFAKIAQAAKEGCPVSKVLAGAEITMDATLV